MAFFCLPAPNIPGVASAISTVATVTVQAKYNKDIISSLVWVSISSFPCIATNFVEHVSRRCYGKLLSMQSSGNKCDTSWLPNYKLMTAYSGTQIL